MYIIEICINEDFYNAYPRNRTVIFVHFFNIDIFYSFPLGGKLQKNQFQKRKGMLVFILEFVLDL